MFKKMILTKAIILILIVGTVLFVLYRTLFNNPTHELPSPLLNQSLPAFTLTNLLDGKRPLSDNVFKNHPISLLNVWATWCYACRIEHDMLMKIKKDYHIAIYSIAYKDHPDKVSEWLKKRNNPYEMVGLDQTGDAAIDLGIYGTPETFIINQTGRVLYRHVGVITEAVWINRMLPVIENNGKL